MYEICDHTADLGIRVRAASLADLLADAARGLTAVICDDPTTIRPLVAESFTIAGTDPAWLLLDWLGEIHAAFEVRRLLFHDVAVIVETQGLQATARGEPYDPARHVLAHEVKAITQHALDVRQTPDGWEAFFIVDI
jgi:SHS2 domain-containing protein